MNRTSAVVLAALLLVAPGVLFGAEQKDPGRTNITVDLKVPKLTGAEAVVKAFVSEELVVDKSEGGIIASIPVVVRYLGVDLGVVTYRATLVANDDKSSQVQLIALYQEHGKPAQPVASNWKKMFVPHWARLERIAAALAATKEAGE
jgi:hypothetical protein